MIVYKLVQCVGSELISYAPLPHSLVVVYRTDRWVEAPVGQLFAYKTFEDAKALISEVVLCRSVEIWKAEAEGVREVKTAIHLGWHKGDEAERLIRDLWAEGWAYQQVNKPPTYHTPMTTMLGCDRIRLIERVYRRA